GAMGAKAVYKPGTIGSLLQYGTAEFDGLVSTALLRRFHASAHPPILDNSATREILLRLDLATVDWSQECRHDLMFTVQSIVTAEKLRAEWNPKTQAKEYERLSADGMKAARLAKALSVAF